MYERFYGLYRPAFAVTPDPSLLYMSRVHREALATIIYGIETRKGFIVCTGEVGTGKTTVIRAFFDQARADSFKIIYIFTPQVSPLEMARYICRELNLPEPESVFAAVPVLQLKLLEIFEGGRTVVLMIDEAQLLPAETLEFLRLLSNFETDTEKLIQIVLVGQPEVDAMLARRDMRQVNQRVALRARLGAFTLEESLDYMEHRLVSCGARELGQVLSPSAAWTIVEAAGGIPRCINILADNVLIAGFGADQRPVGGRLAGVTVRGFIANSGAASPARVRRFGLRRRASRPAEPDVAIAALEPAPGWPQTVEPQPRMVEPEPAFADPPARPTQHDALWHVMKVGSAAAPPAGEPVALEARPRFLGGNAAIDGTTAARASPAASRPIRERKVQEQTRFRLKPRGERAGAS